MWIELLLLGIGAYFLYGKSPKDRETTKPSHRPRQSPWADTEASPPAERDVTNSVTERDSSSRSQENL